MDAQKNHLIKHPNIFFERRIRKQSHFYSQNIYLSKPYDMGKSTIIAPASWALYRYENGQKNRLQSLLLLSIPYLLLFV